MTDSQHEPVDDLFHIGDTVQITGLQTERYNGQLAKIVGPYLTDTERWPIQLYDGNHDQLALKPMNLKRTMPPTYKPSYSSGVYEEAKQQPKTNLRFPVQVFVRIRPLVGLEVKEKHTMVEYNVKKLKKKKTETLTLQKVAGRNNERDKKYGGFKKIIQPDYNNLLTFNNCLLNTSIPYLFDGDHVCVFAYGHTGSGKTHTIFGYKDEPGMYQLFARNLLNDKRVQDPEDVFVEIRFCELYQGKVYDLLSQEKRECFVRESQNGVVHIRAEPVKCDDGKIRAYPISYKHVQAEDELLSVIANGIASRNVGNSTLHDKSSRSHAFLEFELVSSELMKERDKLIEVEADELLIELLLDSFGAMAAAKAKSKKTGKPIPAATLKRLEMIQGLRKGRKYLELDEELKVVQKELKEIRDNLVKLCNDPTRPFVGGTAVFVDLAGNEYGRDVKNKDAQEEAERNEINKSLLALKECIRALHNNKGHIGYRNSKLTMYLKTYLSGEGSKAIMIANIGPSQNYAKQTINTLQYSGLVAKA
eukprot:259308_1